MRTICKNFFDFLAGLQFLTQIKITSQPEWCVQRLGRSVKYFPLIGLMSGSLLAFAAAATAGWMPGTVRIAILICLGFVLHGFLHEDGLMDTADGIFSGQSRERMLEIMIDSRVGAGGVIAIILLFVFKFSLMIDMPSSILPYALLFATINGRYSIVFCICFFPSAKQEGMGHAFAAHAGVRSGFVASLEILVFLGFALFFCLPTVWEAAIMAVICSTGFAWFFGRRLTERLGGMTGDTYGAVCVLVEILTLFVFLSIATFGLGRL